MNLRKRLGILLFKKETTYGTAPSSPSFMRLQAEIHLIEFVSKPSPFVQRLIAARKDQGFQHFLFRLFRRS